MHGRGLESTGTGSLCLRPNDDVVACTLFEHVESVEIQQPLAQHRLEPVGQDGHGVQHGKALAAQGKSEASPGGGWTERRS